MEPCRPLALDIDAYLEDAVRAKQQLDAERWRAELRPRAVREFASRATTLRWSRALPKAAIAELYPDDLFTAIIGNLDRVPSRRWPQVLAVAIALRHGWRRDGLSRLAPRCDSLSGPRHRVSDRSVTPDHHVLDCLARLGLVKALRFASPPRGGAGGLDETLGRAMRRLLRDGRASLWTVQKGGTLMRQLSITPSITVTIGRHTRLYFAFVTTAPTELDSPATVTLHTGTFADVIGFAADAAAHDEIRARTPARLVLVDALELAWQRARYRGHQHLLLPADRVLVGLNTLQQWLWNRLQISPSEVRL